jgi:cold shock CspA family protein
MSGAPRLFSKRRRKKVRGQIIIALPAKRFFYIRSAEYMKLFGHYNQLVEKNDEEKIVVGQTVEFTVTTDAKDRPCAHDVFVVENPRALGTVVNHNPQYGFLETDDGQRLYFNPNYCADSTTYDALRVGDRVRCIIHEFSLNNKMKIAPSAAHVELISDFQEEPTEEWSPWKEATQ